MVERAQTLEAVQTSRSWREIRVWKLRSTIAELARRCVTESRDDPSTLPAALRLALVTVSTGVITALSFQPTEDQLGVLDPARQLVFMSAQATVAVFVAWYVIALLRHADHLPLRQVALPSAGIGICLLVQMVTNQPIVGSDHLYTVYCLVSAIGSFAVTAAALGVIPDDWARNALRGNAVGTALVGVNVFDWVNDTYGIISVVSAIHVLAMCLGVSGTLMLARLPFRRDLPVADDGTPLVAPPA